MKANEVRIGNLVLWGVHISEIKGIHTQSFVTDIPHHFYINILSNKNFSYKAANTDEINKIKLTEEWLLKFGFINVENTSNYWFKMSKKGIEVNVFVEHIRDGVPFDFCSGDDLIIESVHELQNHYYGKTFEDLVYPPSDF